MSDAPAFDRVRRLALGAGAATLLGLAARSLAQAPGSDVVRVRANIELENCEALLKRIARLFERGFGRTEAEMLFRSIDSLPTEQSGTWRFDVVHEGAASTLGVRAAIDELSMVDLDFETTAVIAPQIRRIVFDATDGRGT